MTTICGGGSSGPKLLTDLVSVYSAGRLYQLLLAGGLSELSPFLPLVGAIPIIASAFCATDPPAMSALTSDEANALLNLTFGPDLSSALGKIKDNLLNLIWLDICQCTSGSLTPPTVPALPTDIPVFQVPAPPTNDICVHQAARTVTSYVGPSTGPITSLAVTLARLTWSNTIVSGGGHATSVNLIAFPYSSNTPGNLGSKTFALAAGGSGVFYFPLPVGTGFVRPDFTITSGTGNSADSYTIDLYCGSGAPGAPQEPCCPPDPVTQSYLDLILNLVTLTQRQIAPFATIDGAVHTGLSGNGEINVQGLIGIRIDLTTIPTRVGSQAGDPATIFDVGWIRFGDASSWSPRYRIDADPWIVLPSSAGIYTRVGYSIPADVVATITEIIREP